MRRWGHYGVALVVYAPLGAWLVLSGREALAGVGVALAIALSMAPDLDLRVPGMAHRGSTHTLGFALLTSIGVGLGAFVTGQLLGRPDPSVLAALGGLVAFLSIVSHLLADVVTPKGIAPLWPLSARRYSLRICRADNPLANYLLLALGVAVSVAWYAATGSP